MVPKKRSWPRNSDTPAGCLKETKKINFLGSSLLVLPCCSGSHEKSSIREVLTKEGGGTQEDGLDKVTKAAKNQLKPAIVTPKRQLKRHRVGVLLTERTQNKVPVTGNDRLVPWSQKVVLAGNVFPKRKIEKKKVEVLDLDNAMSLDFQGWDKKETFEKDEQEIVNKYEYAKMQRSMERKAVQNNIDEVSKEKERKEKYSMPALFDINIDVEKEGHFEASVDELSGLEKEAGQTLYRTLHKRENQLRKKAEASRRESRYYHLWKKSQNKMEEKHLRDEEEKFRAAETHIADLGETDFKEFLSEAKLEVEEKHRALQKLVKTQSYPRNLKQAKHMKNRLLMQRGQIVWEAQTREKFYKNEGLSKKFREAGLILEEPQHSIKTPSDASSDDEDDLSVGRKTPSKFKLRGFHSKSQATLRGKFHRRHSLKEFSDKENTLNSRSQLIADDSNFRIFDSAVIVEKPKAESSIKKHMQRPSGHLPKPAKSDVTIKKPKHEKVRRYNLASFLYGAKKKKKEKGSSLQSSVSMPDHEALFRKFTSRKLAKPPVTEEVKQRFRSRYLGFRERENDVSDECPSETESAPESSTPSKREWVPPEEPTADTYNEYDKRSVDTSRDLVAAPQYREAVLRFYPQRRAQDRSETEDHVQISPREIISSLKRLEPRHEMDLTDPRYPYNVPRLVRLPPDEIRSANLQVEKAAYSEFFKARFHHDHVEPNQHKVVQVRYNKRIPKMPYAKVNGGDKATMSEEETRPFGKPVQVCAKRKIVSAADDLQVHEPEDRVESVPNSTKQRYRETICQLSKDINSEFARITEESPEELKTEDEFMERLKAEVESIKSCVSSLESSECTNFSHDSGSYLMINKKKVPLDYMRKSLVPFEEVDRVRLRMENIENMDEYTAPYYTAPYCGQRVEQKKLVRPKDKFFTHSQRCRSDIRDRLLLDIPDFRNLQMGPKFMRGVSKLISVWDQYFQKEIQSRPPIRLFKPKSALQAIRDGLRKNYEAAAIIEKSIMTERVEQKETEYAEKIEELKETCNQLLRSWEEKYYHETMNKIKSIKPYYEKTDSLKKRLSDLQDKLAVLKMKIVFTEDQWIRRTILQNFHYLMMEETWRKEHDWIHQKEDRELETFTESIRNRKTANIRDRSRDDAWAIKEFFEHHFQKQNHPILIVFPNPDSFFEGVAKLKARTFICLLELHFSMWMLRELEQSFNEFRHWSDVYIQERTEFVKLRCSKKYFMEKRVNVLKDTANKLVGQPLLEAIECPKTRPINPLCDILYRNVIASGIGQGLRSDEKAVHKLELVFAYVFDLLAAVDAINPTLRQNIERSYRTELAYEQEQSRQAVLAEKRITAAIEEIKRNMAPPYKKTPRKGKLPRGRLKQKPLPEKEAKKTISKKSALFYQAFTDVDVKEEMLEEADDQDLVNSLEDDCIPFYFDHWLKLHDYEPDYDFQTQIEISDGPEENRFMFKDVLPDVYKSLEIWKINRRRQMEEDITKTLHLYVD